MNDDEIEDILNIGSFIHVYVKSKRNIQNQLCKQNMHVEAAFTFISGYLYKYVKEKESVKECVHCP